VGPGCAWAWIGQVKDLSFCSYSSDQIQVALHLLNYNCIDYKIFASCAKFEEFHANSTFGDFLSIDSILGVSMCFNVDNHPNVHGNKLKDRKKRCNLISFFLIKGIGTRVVLQD